MNINPANMMPSFPKPPVNGNLASEFYKRLVKYIVDFENKLQETEEVGAKLVSFGESILIHVDNMGYWNPSLICFYGKDTNGNSVQLVQHITQISYLLIAVPRMNPERPRLGFKLQNDLNKQ